MCVCYTKSSVLVHLPSRALRVACFWLSPGTAQADLVAMSPVHHNHFISWQHYSLSLLRDEILSSAPHSLSFPTVALRPMHNNLAVRRLYHSVDQTGQWQKRPDRGEASKSIWLRLLPRLHTTREATLFSWRLWPAWQRPTGRCFPFFLFSFPSSLTLLPWITCPVINSLSKELRLGQSSSSNHPHVHPFAYPRNCDIHCFPKMANPTLLHFLWEKNQRTDRSVIGYCLVTALSKLNS